MEEKRECVSNPLNYLIDTFWASLPEKTADELATFKKDVLGAIKDTVDFVIDTEIDWTDRHLANARKMREQYQKPGAPAAEDAPPNPA
jgi:hypothetical protein